MKHKKEIIRWAKSPDGTKVWYKYHDIWDDIDTPTWRPDYTYIVDDEYAEIRKAEVDGKVIEYLDSYFGWGEPINKLAYNLPPKHYRIKPEIKEMTLSEVCKELGREIKIVEESK